jgi:hypothetical protein
MRVELRIPTPTRASDLRSLLAVAGDSNPEVYVQMDGNDAVLYLVQRVDDGRGMGKVLAERTISVLPEEA